MLCKLSSELTVRALCCPQVHPGQQAGQLRGDLLQGHQRRMGRLWRRDSLHTRTAAARGAVANNCDFVGFFTVVVFLGEQNPAMATFLTPACLFGLSVVLVATHLAEQHVLDLHCLAACRSWSPSAVNGGSLQALSPARKLFMSHSMALHPRSVMLNAADYLCWG
jgi:hypothetical protein